MDLEGRRVLVTGASSGIGRAVARAVHRHGGRAALLARSTDQLKALAAELDGSVVATGDVTQSRTVAAAVDVAVRGLGGLDGLVNAAGLAVPGGLRDGDPAAWRAMFEVNVLGLLEVTRQALPHLLESDLAHVVNLSSMSGRRVASPGLAIYAGSKHAVHAIGQGLALELQDTPVRVTTLSPGYVDTPIFEGIEGADDQRRAAATLGLHPEDVAAQVAHVLGQPADVRLVEVAMTSTRQSP